LLVLIYVPFLQPIFGTTSLSLSDWAIMLPLILVPSVAAEVHKWIMRKWGKGRPESKGGRLTRPA
jgi:hypothetical protein